MKAKVVATFLFLIFAFCKIAFGQFSISGIVLDEQNKAIDFVNVSILDPIQNKLLAGTITDQEGKFTLQNNNSGELLLNIQFLGFQDQNISISGKSNLDLNTIILKSIASNLEEVIVTAEKKVMERKGDRVVFNISSSSLKSGYTGMEVLAQSPNIWVDGSNNIQMRSATPTILINGRQLNLSGQNLANYIQNIPSDNIQSIEIQTTAGSDSDANNLGGVINIILKKKILGFRSTIASGLKTYGENFYQIDPSINFNYGAEKWNIYGSYNHLLRDNSYNSRTDILYVDSKDYLLTNRTENYKNNRGNYQIGFVISPLKNHDFGLEYFGGDSYNTTNTIGSLSLTNGEATLDNGIIDATGLFDYDIKNGVLNYAWKFDTMQSTVKLVADATIQNSLEDNDNESTYENNIRSLYDNLETNLFNNKTKILALQGDLDKKFQNRVSLGTGFKFSSTNRDNRLEATTNAKINNETIIDKRFSALTYVENISAGYINLSKFIKENHFFKIGLRVENTNLRKDDLIENDLIKQDYTDWFPSAYYGYDITENSSISLNYSRRLSRPSFTFLNNNIYKVNDFRYYLGNSDLRPEYIDLYEMKFQKKKHSISVYYRQSNDAINGVYTLVDSIAYYQKKNDGKQKQFGIEYSSSIEFNNWWTMRGSIHAYNRKFTNEFGNDSFEKSTLSLRVFNTFKINKNTSFDISVRYMSPTYDAFYQQAEFYFVNFLFKKSFFENKLQCRLYVDDIFNTISWSNTRPFDDIISTNTDDPRSRTLRLWISYTFDNNQKASTRKNQSKNDSRNRL